MTDVLSAFMSWLIMLFVTGASLVFFALVVGGALGLLLTMTERLILRPLFPTRVPPKDTFSGE